MGCDKLQKKMKVGGGFPPGSTLMVWDTAPRWRANWLSHCRRPNDHCSHQSKKRRVIPDLAEHKDEQYKIRHFERWK